MSVMINRLFHWSRSRQRRTLDSAGEFCNALGAGAVFHGSFNGTENSIVYGQVEGNGELEGSLVLAPGSHWRGAITATNVLIAGQVEGDVVAHVKLELAPSARIVGNLTSPRIAIAEGAVYDGVIHAPRGAVTTHFRERRQRDS